SCLPSDDMSKADTNLIKGYLSHEPPLHVRRTLDQFYYFSMKSTEERDRDQTISGESDELLRQNTDTHDMEGIIDPTIIMVDQLWLWIIYHGIYCICHSVEGRNLIVQQIL
ncbi:hypothetical protein BDD12DRAFT_737970, partial [Trichophaea hybrida]